MFIKAILLVVLPMLVALSSQQSTAPSAQSTVSSGASTVSSGPNCALRDSLIAINSTTNSSILLDSIQTAYVNWTASQKMGFNSYYNQAKNVVYNKTSTWTSALKVNQLIVIFSNYNANNKQLQLLLWNVTIAGWGGTIADFIACGNETSVNATTGTPSGTGATATIGTGATATPATAVSGATGSGTGSTPSFDCDDREALLEIDPLTNTTDILDSIQAAYVNWTSSQKLGFNSYYNQARNVIYKNTTYVTMAEKVNQLIVIFKQYNANNKQLQLLLWNVTITGWGGTIADFIACGNETDGGSGGVTTIGTGATGSPVTGVSGVTIPSGTGSSIGFDCDDRDYLLEIDPATNTSIILNSIQAAYVNWTSSQKLGFNSYYNQARNVIYKNISFPTMEEKVNQLIVIFSQYNANNKQLQLLLWNVTIIGWGGTIADFIACGNETDGGSGGVTIIIGTGATGSGGVSGFTISGGTGYTIGSGTGATGSGTGATGSFIMFDCDDRDALLEIDPATNTSIILDSIQIEYVNWTASQKLGFNSYYNQAREVIYKNDTYVSEEEKVNQLLVIFSQYNANNQQFQSLLWNVTIIGWGGTIGDFIGCGNEIVVIGSVGTGATSGTGATATPNTGTPASVPTGITVDISTVTGVSGVTLPTATLQSST